MKTTVLIPAYEPDENLILLLRELREKTGFDIVIVNDGSSEACAPVFEEAKGFGTVLSHEVNRGKGAALRTGIAYIKDYSDAELIITADSDGQHKTSDIVNVVAAAEAAAERTLVLGERHFTGDVPFRSKLGNGVTRVFFRLATGLPVYDTQTGLRAFGRDLFEDFLKIQGDRYEYEMNMLLLCSRNDIAVKGIPIETIYLNENKASHYRTFVDSFRILRGILAFSAASVLSFLFDYLLFFLLTRLIGAATAGQLTLCNVIARIGSATVNFSINRSLVFRKRGNLFRQALSYALLACGILIGNTLLLMLFTQYFHLNELVAKIIAEVIMFVISWVVQRFVVFKNRG